MTNKSMKCAVEFNIRAVSSPGTWLKERGSVYLSVEMFGVTKETILSSPIFPLIFHEELHFEKDFILAYNLTQVSDYLMDEYVRIELIQMNSYDGTLLAWFESPLKSFLYPTPGLATSYGLFDREVLMERSLAFPGISPRLEFSTKTVIEDTNLYGDDISDHYYGPLKSSNRRSRSRTRTRSFERSKSPRQKSYDNSTLASALKIKTGNSDDAKNNSTDDRPPFVVRRIDDDLINRKVSPLTPRPLSRSPERKRHESPMKSSRYNNLSNTNDSKSTYKSEPRNELYSSRDYTQGLTQRSWSPTRLQNIRASIDRALRRNKSLERLEHLERLNRYYYYPPRIWPYYYDYVDELEIELEMARRRLRYM